VTSRRTSRRAPGWSAARCATAARSCSGCAGASRTTSPAARRSAFPLLHPWANRLGDWHYEVAGRAVRLDRDSPPRQPLVDLARDLLGAIGQLLQPRGGGQLGTGTATVRALAQPRRQPARLARGLLDEFARLARELEHRGLVLAGAPRDGAADFAHLAAGRKAAADNAACARAGQSDQLLGLTREHARRVGRQRRVVGVAHVGLHDRRVHAQRTCGEALLADLATDHQSGDLIDHFRARALSLRIVDSSGARSVSAIRQKRCRCSESETWRTSVS
jgi:hypothetical protein